MLSNPSSIDRRRIQHRRQNSTPVLFEATQVRPLPATVQRRIGHRRGLSLEGRPMLLGQNDRPTNHLASQDGYQSVSIDTNYRQLLQQPPTQVAQQHSQPQPGTQIPIPPQTPSVRNSQTVGDASQHTEQDQKRRQVVEKMKELQALMKDFGGDEQMQFNLNMSLMTPETTPKKATFPRGANLDFAPMPSSLGDIKEISLEPPIFDAKLSGLTSPTIDYGYASSYYSDALSPSHGSLPSPQSSPHHQAIHDFDQMSSNGDPVARQLFPNGHMILPPRQVNDCEEALYSPESGSHMSPQPISIAGTAIDATIEDTGISAEEVQQYISPQSPSTGRWTCLYPGCGKDFGRRENIRAHVQTHLGDRQYRCNHCHKRFVRQHDLKRHAKIHTGDKSNRCPCGAGFARQDALTRHRQRGMCVGGFPNAEKKNAKRGRPKKHRPDMESRMEKSSRTRQALASAPSSSSGGSPLSEAMSPYDDFNLEAGQYSSSFQSLESQSNPASDPFSFDNMSAASPMSNSATSFGGSSDHVAPDSIMMSRSTTQRSLGSFARTPPMSPSDSTSPASVPSPLHMNEGSTSSSHKRHITPPGSPLPQDLNSNMQSYEAMFSPSYEFSNSFCGGGLDGTSMDAFITGIDSLDNGMDFKDISATAFDALM